MKFIKSKKALVLLATLAVAVAAAIGAYAYWSAGGSGSGTATAGTTTDNLTIAADGWAGLIPGAANALPVNVTVTNPNTFATHVNDVVLDTSFGGGTGVTTSNALCLPAWFTVTGSPLTLNTEIAAGGNTGSQSFGTIALSDLPSTDQNSCKSADITVHFTSN